MKFTPIAKIREMFADIKRGFFDLYYQRPENEAKFERQVDQHLEYLLKHYGEILVAFKSDIERELREGGKLYRFGESEHWPVFKELLDGLIYRAAAENLNLFVAPEIQKQNAALAEAALIIQAAIDGHIEGCELDRFILEKCSEAAGRIEIKRKRNSQRG